MHDDCAMILSASRSAADPGLSVPLDTFVTMGVPTDFARPSAESVVPDERLRLAVGRARSWRGVLRGLGLPESASGTARRLRRRADELGLTYDHFAYQRPRWTSSELEGAVTTSMSWQQVMQRLGYAPASGSARESVRRMCARHAIETAHLEHPPYLSGRNLVCEPHGQHLRSAGSMLVAAVLTLAGHRVSWPLEPTVYDLLVDVVDQPAQRVQVKTTTRQVDGTWLCNMTRSASGVAGVRYSLDDIDHFGVVDGDYVVYLVPAVAVGGLTSIYTRAYGRYRVGRLTD
jgi:hypothetical protein